MKIGLAVVLSLCLCVSLGINVYLWLSLRQYNTPANEQIPTSEPLSQDVTQSFSHRHSASSTGSSSVGKAASLPSNPRNKGTALREPSFETATFQASKNDMDALEALLKNGQYSLLATTLTNYLKNAPSNESLLLLEGELIELTKPLPTALVHYYDLSELPLSQETLTLIDTKIATLYKKAQTQLRRDEQWELVAKLNEPLFQRIPDAERPDARHYALNLAEAYAHQQKLTLMEDVLAALPASDRDANAIRDKAYEIRAITNEDSTPSENQLQQENASNERNQTRVALERIGDQYRITAKALNQNATMILDTGASTTAISSELFARLGRMRNLTFIGNFNVGTASGTIEAPLVQIPRFYFAGYEFSNVSAIVLPEEALPDADGLLGMNILGEFDFSILPQSSELLLSERN